MSLFHHIKHHQIDFQKWDHAILSSESPLVFAQSFYLNATSPGWEALVIGDYECVFPLTVRQKLGFTYLPQPPFTSQLGLFGNTSPEKEKLFFEYITQKFRLVEIELNSTNQLKNHFVNSKNTYIIDYTLPFTYNKNTVRNINKALQKKLRVEMVKPDESIRLSFNYLNPFLINELSLSRYAIKRFEKLIYNSIEAKQLITFKVVDEKNNLKAMAHFVFNTKHALFLKGTNFDKKEQSGSMHLLLDHAIHYFKDKSLIFDFGGGSISVGLALFYSGLGGKKLDYSIISWNKLPAIPNLIKKLKSVIQLYKR